MRSRLRVALFLGTGLLAIVAGCTLGDRPSGGASEWVGSITTEGNVTTVVNESGSVWGGTARLVEEASIGADLAEDPYMLGDIVGLLATNDEIVVVDNQVPVVRVYDMSGRYLRDLGAEGQGPGEYTNPSFLAAGPDGRVFVLDTSMARVNVYGPEADDVESWPLASPRCCVHPMQMGPEGTLWLESLVFADGEPRPTDAVRPHGPEGPVGEPFVVPEYPTESWALTMDGREFRVVPWTPVRHWNIHPSGAVVVGASDRYRFEIAYPDGRRTVVERFWDPVSLTRQEVDYVQRTMEQLLEAWRVRSGEAPMWDGRIPATKPAFVRLQVAATGEIWVVREKAAVSVPNCEPTHDGYGSPPRVSAAGIQPSGECFVWSYVADVFESGGRYLGSADLPAMHPYMVVSGDIVLLRVEDEAGTVMVKRYRLVLPGEE